MRTLPWARSVAHALVRAAPAFSRRKSVEKVSTPHAGARALQESVEPGHRFFQNRHVRRVADADATLAARAEGGARRQPYFGFEQKPFAEGEGIANSFNARKNVEGSFWNRHSHPAHGA